MNHIANRNILANLFVLIITFVRFSSQNYPSKKFSDPMSSDHVVASDIFNQIDGLLERPSHQEKTPADSLPYARNDGVPFPASIIKLTDLAKAEQFIYSVLEGCQRQRNSIKLDKHFSSIVTQYLADYDASTGSILLESTESRSIAVAENPLAFYLMLRRFGHQLNSLRSSHGFPCQKFHNQAALVQAEIGWPTKLDIEDAGIRILRLQQVYNLPVEDIFKGKLLNIETNVSLPIDASFALSKIALQYSYFTLSLEWLGWLEKVTQKGKSVQRYLSRIRKMRIEAELQHDRTWKKMSMKILTGSEYHYNKRIKLHRKQLETGQAIKFPLVPRRMSMYQKLWGQKSANLPLIPYWALCSGHYYQSEKVKSKLFCWLDGERDFTWRIRPLKMEFLSRSPDIVQIYDVLTDKMIERMKARALTKFFESEVGDPTNINRTRKVKLHRSSIQAWVKNLEDEELAGISRIVSKITGLQLGRWSFEEYLQILSYSSGGHFTMHKDAYQNIHTSHDDPQLERERMATFMFYLSDVRSGGQTAFASAGTVANPVKGSGVFWYNTDSDGLFDNRSYHAGCPVILGQKWAANKWIKYRGQFAVQKCGLKKGTKIQVEYKARKMSK